jgi:hypothetical protein
MSVRASSFLWGRLAACGGLLTRLERRLATGAQLNKPPHKKNRRKIWPG